MERLRISRSLEAGKYLVTVIAVISIVVLFYTYNDANTSIPCMIFLAMSGILYYLFSIAKTVEFDEQHLFISDKKRSEVIPLNNVFKIKLTMTQINNDNFWKIKYIGNDGKENVVRILPQRENFEVFKKTVEQKNSQVEIRKWSHSFDVDQ